MSDHDQQYRGNDSDAYRREFTEREVGVTSDLAKVRAWNRRIKRDLEALEMERRENAAEAAEDFLAPTRRDKSEREKLYMPYLLPILEDAIERTMPRIPSPTIEDRNELVEGYGERARELIGWSFRAPQCGVVEAAEGALWEDARWAAAFVKTTWRTQYEMRAPDHTTDESTVASETAQAQMENEDPVAARISDTDVHEIHVEVHMGHLALMPQGDAGYEVLVGHIMLHEAEMASVLREWPQAELVPTDRFVYDTTVPWEKRRYEAEKRSFRVSKLFEMKYRNLNPQNLPPEERPAGSALAWEDMTAQVWEIHDIENGELWVIPINGSEDGLPLYKGRWDWGTVDIYIPLVMRPYKGKRRQLHGQATVDLCAPVLERLAELDFANDVHIREHKNWKQGLPPGTAKSIKADLNDPDKRYFEAPIETLTLIKGVQYAPPPLPPGNLQQHAELTSKLRALTGGDAQDTGASHPHQISASESLRRSSAADNRIRKNQKRLSCVLAQIAKNFLQLYKQFATKNKMVRVVGPMGPEYMPVDPSDLPDDIDLFIDLQGESDEARAVEYQVARESFEWSVSLGYPLDIPEAVEYVMRRAGVHRPERFRAAPMLPPEAAPTGVGAPVDGEIPGTIPISAYQSGQGQTPMPAMTESAGAF